jgi:hypothetical protein
MVSLKELHLLILSPKYCVAPQEMLPAMTEAKLGLGWLRGVV